LQHLLWIFEKVLELVRLSTKHLRGQLRSHLDSGNGTVFRDKSNFVDFDAWIASQRGLQLFRQRTWFRVSAGKCAHEPREARLRRIGCEVNAGNSRGGQ